MVTVEQVKTTFTGKEPSRRGYGSEFRFEEHKEGVVVELEAQWMPRFETPSVLVVGVDGPNVSYRNRGHLRDSFVSDVETDDVEGVARSLAEYGEY